MHPSVRGPANPQENEPSGQVTLDLLKWHLDRYDRLRSSTAARASVVLSAGAILMAGNAIVLAQLLGGSEQGIDVRLRLILVSGLMVTALLVVLVILRASGVLVTLKDSRSLFSAGGGRLPQALLFNGPDTVRGCASFEDFRSAIDRQTGDMLMTAAQVELWFVIHQHRHRYTRLRAAVRWLRWSAFTFLVSLTGFATAVLMSAL